MSRDSSTDFVYDVKRFVGLRRIVHDLARDDGGRLYVLTSEPAQPCQIAVLAGSYNPLTRAHATLADAALREGASAVLLLMPLQAVDKERVTRADTVDRALVLLEWASHRQGIEVGLVNRGLYVEMAALVSARYPGADIAFVVGYDKIVQIFDSRYYADRDAALGRLFDLARFQVAPRQGEGDQALRALLGKPENAPFAHGVTPLPLPPDVSALSSTQVRDAARAGQPWVSLVPREAATFIEEALPYATPILLSNGESIDPYELRQALFRDAASGRLTPNADLAALARQSRADSVLGRQLRARLGFGS